MKRTVWSTFIVLVMLSLVFGLWQFRSVVWLFLISIVTAATFRPYIQFFSRRGLTWNVALAAGYSVAILGLVAFLAVWTFLVLKELPVLVNDLTRGYEVLRRAWPAGTPLQQAIAGRLPQAESFYTALFGEEPGTLARVTTLTSFLTQNLGYLVIILTLSAYWTADQIQFERLWLSFIPVGERSRAREIWREVETNVGAYMRSEIIQSILAAVALGLGYWAMGLGYPVLLATVSAVFWLLPVLGFVPGLIVVTLSALFYNPGVLWLAVIFTLTIFILLEWIIEPRLFSRNNFSSLLLLAMLVIFIERLGIFGLLIAPPVAVAVQIFGQRLLRDRISTSVSAESITLADIQQELESVSALLDKTTPESPASPKTLGLFSRLEALVTETEQVVKLVTKETSEH